MTDMTGVLDRLCPMHLVANSFGVITHVGPTLRKLKPFDDLTGHRLFDVFEINRPGGIDTVAALRAADGVKLHLQFKEGSDTSFKGVIAPYSETGAVVLNFSFGIGVIDAVSEYSLSSTDFAHTDLTIEMLYLVEAKSAAMEESRGLITRLQGARIAAEEQAFTDTLTGLKNRRAMDFVLARLIAKGQSFAMVQLDLDYFKTVNDTLGHAAGDFVLQHVAKILVDETRSDDTIARVGGDEFVLVLNGLIDRDKISEILTRMIRKIEKPVLFEGQPCKVSCSAGTSLSSHYTSPQLDEMLADADAALYVSKRQGRACHTFYTDTLAADHCEPLPKAAV